MNQREFKCVSILTDLIENHGLIGIKTSFEDEGASFNETIRLKEICNQAKTKLTLKISGPEASRDIQDSQIIGVKGLVAPMVESRFGLQKFLKCVNSLLPQDVVNSLQLGVNIETIQAYSNIHQILSIPEINTLNSITLGRVDFVSSMGETREYVNSNKILNISFEIFKKARLKNLKTNLGGAITIDSKDFIVKLSSEGLLDKFETRYVIFDASQAIKNFKEALNKAQQFEYEWLVNKKEYYQNLSDRDNIRIQMISQRLSK